MAPSGPLSKTLSGQGRSSRFWPPDARFRRRQKWRSEYSNGRNRGCSPTFKSCISGKELIDRGFDRDVELAAEFDVSDAVPLLAREAYIQFDGRSLDNDFAT